LLCEDQVKLHDLRNEHVKLSGAKKEVTLSRDRIAELEALVKELKAKLATERDEKSAAIQERDTIRKGKDEVCTNNQIIHILVLLIIKRSNKIICVVLVTDLH